MNLKFQERLSEKNKETNKKHEHNNSPRSLNADGSSKFAVIIISLSVKSEAR